jgi:amino acid transporter
LHLVFICVQGWNLTLEYAISAAAVARGWSQNFRLFFSQVGAPYPDWMDTVDIGFTDVSPMALVICLLCTGALLVGAKESALLNKVVTIMNICCIMFIIILGSTQITPSFWSGSSTTNDLVFDFANSSNATCVIPISNHSCYVPQDHAPSDCAGDHSGFVPCGFNGILLGAVKVCSYILSRTALYSPKILTVFRFFSLTSGSTR